MYGLSATQHYLPPHIRSLPNFHRCVCSAEAKAFLITQDEWREVAQQFGTRWNFHNAIGAFDGKRIAK